MKDDFEKKLMALAGALHRPDPTPAWKADILARARREAGAIPIKLPPRALALAWGCGMGGHRADEFCNAAECRSKPGFRPRGLPRGLESGGLHRLNFNAHRPGPAIQPQRRVPMRNFIKRLWLRRWFRGCTWIAFTLFTLLILVRQYIGLSGARRWVAVQEMIAREGESIDFRKAAPEPVPDEQNFFAIPPLKDLPLCSGRTDDKSELGLKLKRLNDSWPPNASNSGPGPKLLSGPGFGKATDLKAWVVWLRKDGSLPAPPDTGDPARDVLAALSRDDALVGELALGLSRPESQWTPAWRMRVLPEPLFTVSLQYIISARGVINMLCLRGAAAARAGDAAKAHESLLIAGRINEANMQEPSLVGALVACAEVTLISGAVWELCDAHAGTAEDFRKLQEELSRFDFQKSLLCAERGELALGVNITGYFRRRKDLNTFMATLAMNGVPPGRIGPGAFLMGHLIPDGWYDGNAATIAQWHLDYGIKPLRDANFTELMSKQKELNALIMEHKSHPFSHLDEVMGAILTPVMETVTRKVVYAQSVVNEAIAACALERYRIKHDSYPDTLEAANRPGEKSIPPDVISGKPMGYRKTPNGRYALWCFGIDGKDHGGKRVFDEQRPEETRFSDAKYPGDWVWDFPAK